MWRTVGCYLRWSRACPDTLKSAVIAHPVEGRVVDHTTVVDIRDVSVAYVIYRAVVGEFVTMPVTALVAPSDISKPVVDTAVISNIAAPVAMIEGVSAAAVPPISRRPESSRVRRGGPGSRHPVIASRSVAPVSRSPNITRFRDRRLFILG
jgi:hypothetical protein